MKRLSEIPALILTGLVYAILYPAMALHTWLFSPRKAKEIPPVEERPHIPAPAQNALAEAQRIEQALRAEFLREAMAARRREETRVKAEVDRLLHSVGSY